jgi:hypothetical protein
MPRAQTSEAPSAAASRLKAPATFVTTTLAVSGLASLFDLAFTLVQLVRPSGSEAAQDAANAFSAVTAVVNCVCGISFLVWVSRVFQVARALRVPPGRYTATSVNVGFLIPILNLIRPYRGLRELDEAIDPTTLPEPRPRPETGEHTGGYREPALAGGVGGPDLRRPPLLGWWALWIGRAFFAVLASYASSQASVVAALTDALCAALAIVVIHRFSVRLGERARRLEGMDPCDRAL